MQTLSSSSSDMSLTHSKLCHKLSSKCACELGSCAWPSMHAAEQLKDELKLHHLDTSKLGQALARAACLKRHVPAPAFSAMASTP